MAGAVPVTAGSPGRSRWRAGMNRSGDHLVSQADPVPPVGTTTMAGLEKVLLSTLAYQRPVASAFQVLLACDLAVQLRQST